MVLSNGIKRITVAADKTMKPVANPKKQLGRLELEHTRLRQEKDQLLQEHARLESQVAAMESENARLAAELAKVQKDSNSACENT